MAEYPYTDICEIKEVSYRMIGACSPVFTATDHENFKIKFGVTVYVCALAWNRMVTKLNGIGHRMEDSEFRSLKVMHILYALLFLRMYPKSRQLNGLFDEPVMSKTFRKWCYFVINALEGIYDDVVSFLFILLLLFVWKLLMTFSMYIDYLDK